MTVQRCEKLTEQVMHGRQLLHMLSVKLLDQVGTSYVSIYYFSIVVRTVRRTGL